MFFFSFPGHTENKFWPIVIPEHYGERCSQHMFDPYSIIHFGYGILSYSVFGFLDGDGDDSFFNYDNSRFNFKEDRSPFSRKFQKENDNNNKSSGLGLLTTLIYATIAEMVEFTEKLMEDPVFRKRIVSIDCFETFSSGIYL